MVVLGGGGNGRGTPVGSRLRASALQVHQPQGCNSVGYGISGLGYTIVKFVALPPIWRSPSKRVHLQPQTPTRNFKPQTPIPRYPTPNTQHSTPSTQHPTPNTQTPEHTPDPTPLTPNPTSGHAGGTRGSARRPRGREGGTTSGLASAAARCVWDLIVALRKYSVGLSVRPICTRR